MKPHSPKQDPVIGYFRGRLKQERCPTDRISETIRKAEKNGIPFDELIDKLNTNKK